MMLPLRHIWGTVHSVEWRFGCLIVWTETVYGDLVRCVVLAYQLLTRS